MRRADLTPPAQGGLGRAFAVAIVFSGGLYALAAALIGLV